MVGPWRRNTATNKGIGTYRLVLHPSFTSIMHYWSAQNPYLCNRYVETRKIRPYFVTGNRHKGLIPPGHAPIKYIVCLSLEMFVITCAIYQKPKSGKPGRCELREKHLVFTEQSIHGLALSLSTLQLVQLFLLSLVPCARAVVVAHGSIT
jgi:hypothetical protein